MLSDHITVIMQYWWDKTLARSGDINKDDSGILSLVIKCFGITNTSVQNFTTCIRISSVKTVPKCLRKLIFFNPFFAPLLNMRRCTLWIYVNKLLLSVVDINECDYYPCENNGTCDNNAGSYVCNCTDGWQGHDCERGNVITLSEDFNLVIKLLCCDDNIYCMCTYFSGIHILAEVALNQMRSFMNALKYWKTLSGNR